MQPDDEDLRSVRFVAYLEDLTQVNWAASSNKTGFGSRPQRFLAGSACCRHIRRFDFVVVGSGKSTVLIHYTCLGL